MLKRGRDLVATLKGPADSADSDLQKLYTPISECDTLCRPVTQRYHGPTSAGHDSWQHPPSGLPHDPTEYNCCGTPTENAQAEHFIGTLVTLKLRYTSDYAALPSVENCRHPSDYRSYSGISRLKGEYIPIIISITSPNM